MNPDNPLDVLRTASEELRAVRGEMAAYNTRMDDLDTKERELDKNARGNRRLTVILAGVIAAVAVGAGVSVALVNSNAATATAAAAEVRAHAEDAAIAAVKAEDHKLCASGNVYRARERAAMEGTRGALNGPPWQETPESRAYAERLKADVAQLTTPRDCAHL